MVESDDKASIDSFFMAEISGFDISKLDFYKGDQMAGALSYEE